jgi:hypothetical protein
MGREARQKDEIIATARCSKMSAANVGLIQAATWNYEK